MRAVVWFLVTLAFLPSCRSVDQEQSADASGEARLEVTGAMERYQEATRRVDQDAIASFYAPDGTLFEPGIRPISTPDSIRAFIASFPGVTVDSASATLDTIEVFGGTAYLWGSYFERLSFPGQPVSEQHGKFVAQWMRQPDGAWLMRRLFRVPVTTLFPEG